MNIRKLVSLIISLIITIAVPVFTFNSIVERDSTVNQPVLIEMTDLGYDNSETTNAIIRDFSQSGYTGKVYSLKIKTQAPDASISFHIDLLKCAQYDQAEEFYFQLLIDMLHSERKMRICGTKDNCYLPKFSLDKTLSQLSIIDSTLLNSDQAYAFFDPFTATLDNQNNKIFILKDSLILVIEPWGMNHLFTQTQLLKLMTLFENAELVFHE